ncbi:MAG: hypothetical protein A2293_16220 [Elusimicrobia bacterium RIFOXYB2_FULL_49_7]|nr:MAG: hypothetical protein A2293_16220 [Elusimicrobia bacterium RIFOXYB2_FULL_49_7]
MDLKEIREEAVRETKRTLILDAAIQVFAEKGYHETRLEDIAAKAGFSKASLYNYYPDKESIFFNLVVLKHEDLYKVLNERIDPAASIRTKLEILFNTIFAFFGEHFAIILAMSSHESDCLIHNGGVGRKFHKELIHGFQAWDAKVKSYVSEMLRLAEERNEICLVAPAPVVSMYLLSPISSVLRSWKWAGKIGDIRETVTQLCDILMNGLSCRK